MNKKTFFTILLSTVLLTQFKLSSVNAQNINEVKSTVVDEVIVSNILPSGEDLFFYETNLEQDDSIQNLYSNEINKQTEELETQTKDLEQDLAMEVLEIQTEGSDQDLAPEELETHTKDLEQDLSTEVLEVQTEGSNQELEIQTEDSTKILVSDELEANFGTTSQISELDGRGEDSDEAVRQMSSSIQKIVTYSFTSTPPERIFYDDGAYRGYLARQYISFYQGLYYAQYAGIVFMY